MSSQQFPAPRSPILQATRCFRSPGSSRRELIAAEQFPCEPSIELTRKHHQKEPTDKRLEPTPTGMAITLQSSKERNIWDFEINGVNPISTRDLMIDAMQTQGLTFGRAYTEVMESFFGSEKTSSSNYMEKEGEEEKDSSSSSDEEVQRNKPPSPMIQSPATSKKQSKKSVKKKGGREASQTPNTKQYDNYFQLAFRDGKVWDLQEEIFKLHEQEKLKGQKLSKSHASLKGKGVSKEDSPKPILEDMKITPWKQLQGIREKSLMAIAILLRVKDGSISLEQIREEFERDEEMSTFVTPRPYTLAIADAPYGFSVPNSINDDVKYRGSAYKKVIEAFKKIITCDSWSLVFFHDHDQITTAQKAFTDANMTCQMLTWIKPNIHGYKLDRLSWAYTTTVSALKRGQNVIAVECYPLPVKFIEQRVTALMELSNEFQEVGMKSMASDRHFFDAYGEPQPPIGSEKVGEIVDLVDFEPDNVEVEEQASDTPLQITSMGEETRNEEEEDLPIQA
ncbi:hypothetical protein L7F22_025291 [Adiantum nelumboides]|nr:hypothetical protein [Adiantum nelumboides]